jgi:pSer/pThr/pTyr-binding forkhead associated (FHA) protein
MASIIVVSGPQKGDYYPLGKRTNVIGRAETNPIQILDERASRKHVQIYFNEDKQRYYALDMKSTHGVFINGSKIKDETVLANDDQIRIGETTLFFTVKDFPDRESAMSHFKKVGERIRTTLIDDKR